MNLWKNFEKQLACFGKACLNVHVSFDDMLKMKKKSEHDNSRQRFNKFFKRSKNV